jgi:predicted Zn-dependent protease
MHSKSFVLIIVISFLSSAGQAGQHTANDHFIKAQEFYEATEFNAARRILEELVTEYPENSIYHHLLGKSYGRIAEKSNPFKAMSMAKKTRKAFEKAVELDDKNIKALEDLMQYYLDAPGFLGGSKTKAEEIQKRLDLIQRSL